MACFNTSQPLKSSCKPGVFRWGQVGSNGHVEHQYHDAKLSQTYLKTGYDGGDVFQVGCSDSTALNIDNVCVCGTDVSAQANNNKWGLKTAYHAPPGSLGKVSKVAHDLIIERGPSDASGRCAYNNMDLQPGTQ